MSDEDVLFFGARNFQARILVSLVELAFRQFWCCDSSMSSPGAAFVMVAIALLRVSLAGAFSTCSLATVRSGPGPVTGHPSIPSALPRRGAPRPVFGSKASPWPLSLREAPRPRDTQTACRNLCAAAGGGEGESVMPLAEAEGLLGTFDREQQVVARDGFEGQREGFGGGTSAAKFAEASRPEWPRLRRAVLSLATESEKVCPRSALSCLCFRRR